MAIQQSLRGTESNKLDKEVRLGTRGSVLARWQTNYVQTLLRELWPRLEFTVDVMTTKGDRVIDKPLPLIGGKGLFTAELEAALHSGTIDIAVHSLKDLPTDSPDGLTIGAIPQRANPADVFVSRADYTIDTLPKGATIGTSSRRRMAQLLHVRPDIQIRDIRGNVDTRIQKALAAEGPYDAVVLAHAGLERIDRLDVVSQILPFDLMLPAPGQGALAVQCRDDVASHQLLTLLQHQPSAAAVTAERAFLAALGGGCSTPVAAYAEVGAHTLHLRGRVTSVDGVHQVDVSDFGETAQAVELGQHLATVALEQGAREILWDEMY
ncbi:hydroxymethylbilane synthase [Chloroflexi bacterium TSY]|nr:hydroxymethylbilane synthase [Chloroflexi bacterium TSY]